LHGRAGRLAAKNGGSRPPGGQLVGLSFAGGLAPGSAGDPGAFFGSLSALLMASQALSVLDMSDCHLELDALPPQARAPLQVLNLGGNSITASADSLHSLARSLGKTLQLLSLRGVTAAAGLSLGDGLAALDACVDLSGLQVSGGAGVAGCVQLGAGGLRTLVLRDVAPAQVPPAQGSSAHPRYAHASMWSGRAARWWRS
jgi:hypothetical protein